MGDALALSLQYSAQKWQGGIRISGGDFAFKMRAVRMAVEQGISIQNIELRDLEKQILAEREGRPLAERAPERVASAMERVSPAPLPPLSPASTDDFDIEMPVRALDEHAHLSPANTQGGRYTGSIVAENARFLAQSVGKHRYVLHERGAFADAPAPGQPVTIQYQSGKACQRRAQFPQNGEYPSDADNAAVQTPRTRSAGRGSR